MEVPIGIGSAVRRHQYIRPVKPGGLDGHQLELHRPLPQLAGAMAALGHFRLRGQRPHPAAGAAALSRSLLGLGLQHGGLIVGRGFPGLEGDCPGGAAGQAVPQAVAIVLPGKVGLAANEGNGPLVTGLDAQAAAVAFFLIDMNNLTNHRWFLHFVILCFLSAEPLRSAAASSCALISGSRYPFRGDVFSCPFSINRNRPGQRCRSNILFMAVFKYNLPPVKCASFTYVHLLQCTKCTFIGK